ncbi:lantibiotic dehydratase [Streptomyces sp. NPDC059477]|uniref:lantibiotic dehydratase n=1 Tax=Streptomyces sp. NPDC059477 TaxID=3346847 RepID=UPI0036793379
MPHPAGPATTGSRSSTGTYTVRSAPYALARATVLRHPAQSPAAAAFRSELALLAALEAEESALLPEVCDALYDSRSGHTQAFHRDVVLPLRRSLHNGRAPRPALLDRLGDLPERVPRLADWLALRDRRSTLLAALDPVATAALAAEREALSALCREPALTRAVALTSSDLLRAVERAGTGTDDRRARKEEPSVLRYALRASTKTSPLSWFTAVGWGRLAERSPERGVPSWGEEGIPTGPLTSVVKVNRTLVSVLSTALLDDPRYRATLPHRMTSTARVVDGRATYARSRVVFAGGRYLVTNEDEAGLAVSGPLELITSLCETPVMPEELAAALSNAVKDARGSTAAAAFLDRLTGAGLLVPTEPVDPQADDPLADLARWLRASPGGSSMADRIDEIADGTRQFADVEAGRRPVLLAGLSARWRTLLAEAGRPVPAPVTALNVLSEDVVAPRPIQLGGFLADADHEALGEVTALAELFDLGHLIRRITRDRFVARYGTGGICHHPWEFGADIAEALEETGRLAALAPQDQDAFPSGIAELAALRRSVLDAAHGGTTDDGTTDDGTTHGGTTHGELKGTGAAHGPQDAATDLVLPADLIRGIGARLPDWAVERPLSYSYFLQRDTADGLLCVNHVYGGWGRFTSRFLDSMDPGATDEVTRQIRRGLGDRARAAQVRPVGGFNANLHPLLVPDEIGPDRRWASIGEPEVDLVHDEESDQVRLRLRATGELLDVLYDGFLAPVVLPRRLAAFLSDHPNGVVDFRALVPQYAMEAPGGRVIRTPRLRHRHVVLRRRRWQLTAGVVRTLRTELAADHAVPAETTARWRTLLDLPEQLFLHPVPAAPKGRAAEDLFAQLRLPKPQFTDLGNALHLRCLGKWLSRHPDGVVLEEALPAPGGRPRPAQAVELVVETYRAGRPS